MKIKVNEYGVVFRFGTSFDMSAWSGLTLTFTKADGETQLVVTNPQVTLGVVDVNTPFGTFLANQYALYTFKQGDVDQVGLWHVYLTYDSGSSIHFVSDTFTFSVVDPACGSSDGC